jgi:hypothetical protein
MDETFVILPHGPKKLEEFFDCLNGLHRNIQFTMETKKEGHLPFLDIDIIGDRMAPWAIKSTINLHTLTYT